MFSMVPDWPNSDVLVFAQHNCPGGLDPLHNDRVDLGSSITEQVGAEGGGDALAHLQVFDGDGDAVQRTQGPAAGATASSAALASAIAWSLQRARYEFSRGSKRSMR